MALLAVAGTVLAGCGTTLENIKLTMATGRLDGVYNTLGNALADIWSGRLGIARPQVVATAGSVDNVNRLVTGQADVGFSQSDATDAAGAGKLRALARMHDDYLQIMVRADVPAVKLADLAGLRISVGEPNSGVELIAKRLLDSAGVNPTKIERLGLVDAANAMQQGTLDAFFWSGGLPTPRITTLTKSLGVRMLDLSDVLPKLRETYPAYGSATLPASTYNLQSGPVTTLTVRNFLLATDAMSDEVAEALVRQLFEALPDLVKANSAARTIEPRSAIETTPVPLHPGAMKYYREVKV
jgi:uncharacterized protein